MKPSLLTLVSYGVVASNKPLSTKNIEVTPVEQVTMMNGELTDSLTSTNNKGKNADGSSYETTVHTAPSITATWLPFGSNRKTAPDVRRGEKVCVWKFADADKYYWSELEYNGKLRKLETVIFMLSNTQEESAEPDGDNTYFLEWSTHNKLVHLHTSTSDGEAFGYDFILNTKDSTFQIRDTAENTIFLDSADKRITLKNAEGTFMDLFGKDLFINVEGNMVTQVKGDMSTVVTGKYALQADGGAITQAPTVDFVTPKMTTSEDFAAINNAVVGGSLELGKGLTTGGAGGGSITLKGGNFTLEGDMTSTGSATFSGPVNAPNI